MCLKSVPIVGLTAGGMSPLMNKREPGREAEHWIFNYPCRFGDSLLPWLVLIPPLALSKTIAEHQSGGSFTTEDVPKYVFL